VTDKLGDGHGEALAFGNSWQKRALILACTSQRAAGWLAGENLSPEPLSAPLTEQHQIEKPVSVMRPTGIPLSHVLLLPLQCLAQPEPELTIQNHGFLSCELCDGRRVQLPKQHHPTIYEERRMEANASMLLPSSFYGLFQSLVRNQHGGRLQRIVDAAHRLTRAANSIAIRLLESTAVRRPTGRLSRTET
jgi:hypothetical protein